ncbi:MAG: M3 family metallopeptidase [Deltaproteobacteria bacterium]
MSKNPLLFTGGLPPFDAIEVSHIVPAMRELLADLAQELAKLETAAEPSWEAAVEAPSALGERLGRAWGVVGHLMGVQNSDDLRTAHETMQPEIVAFGLQMAQSQPLYRALEGLAAGAGFAALDATQQRIVTSGLRDAKLAGVALTGAAKDRFNAIQAELAECSTKFSNHVLDATKAFSLVLHDPAEVDGLPESLKQLAAHGASSEGDAAATPEAGPWRITLDAPSVGPFLQHAKRRDLREAIYREYITRASTGADDNTGLIAEILKLRREEARLLGFEDFAALSLSTKMAPDVESVAAMLEDLRTASFASAEKDLRDLQELAAEMGAPEGAGLKPWDISFWAERLREKRYAYSDEALRPYFPMPRVLDGLFRLAERLFGVKIKAADGEAPLWNEAVRFFRVCDEEGSEIAAFYLDAYSRPAEKRGGAWMDECIGRAPGKKPVAYLICNQAPPVGDKPSLMSFLEVSTLFHEFGHGLQHMLTQVERPMASGIRNIEWDAVELPSQFMENWCYEREVLLGLSQHIETGEKLPEEIFEKIRAARTYRAGSDMLRQLYFSMTDIALHHELDPSSGESAFDVQRRIAEKTTVLPPLAEDRFLCSFGHIFAGGYAAGYYSYKWAEVLSADAFAAFEEAGLDDEEAIRETGRRFRDTVLGLGGSRPPMEVFAAFRGRAPTTEALLRHAGLR